MYHIKLCMLLIT